jgi:hypothetical protein
LAQTMSNQSDQKTTHKLKLRKTKQQIITLRYELRRTGTFLD